MDIEQVICSINKNAGYIYCFNGDTTKKLYWINSQGLACGKSNMKDHPNYTNFRHSLRCNMPETSFDVNGLVKALVRKGTVRTGLSTRFNWVGLGQQSRVCFHGALPKKVFLTL